MKSLIPAPIKKMGYVPVLISFTPFISRYYRPLSSLLFLTINDAQISIRESICYLDEFHKTFESNYISIWDCKNIERIDEFSHAKPIDFHVEFEIHHIEYTHQTCAYCLPIYKSEELYCSFQHKICYGKSFQDEKHFCWSVPSYIRGTEFHNKNIVFDQNCHRFREINVNHLGIIL